MNRSQLATAFAERLDVKPKQGREILDTLVELITENVTAGEVVTISGFAKFARRDQGPRMVRNPATGEMLKKGATRKVRITALKAFKDTVMSGKVPKKAAKAAPKKAAKKAPVRKTAAKKAPVRKTAAKKAPVRKTAAKKAPARKTAKRR